MMNFNEFTLDRDSTGIATNAPIGLPFTANNVYIALAADTEATTTVPSGDYQWYEAVFRYTPNGTIFVAPGSVAITVPTGSFAATPACLNPPNARVAAGSTLRFITHDSASSVSVSYYGRN
jgi:hypothetical protein